MAMPSKYTTELICENYLFQECFWVQKQVQRVNSCVVDILKCVHTVEKVWVSYCAHGCLPGL